MLNVEFKKGQWEEFFDHAYTGRYEVKPKFVQDDGFIKNGENKNNEYGYDQTSIVAKQKFGIGAKIKTCCEFDKDYAPLILLTRSLYKDDDGDVRFNDYYEVVLYKDGINVWKLYNDSTENKMKWYKLLALNFNVAPAKKHILEVEIVENGIKIKCGSEDAFLRISDLPEEMNAGITACEGLNKFYSFSIED